MGAWIEIVLISKVEAGKRGASVWGRGLKYCLAVSISGYGAGRPRMGAWIEIRAAAGTDSLSSVAPVWGRGLK